jgi:hypothetical protein
MCDSQREALPKLPSAFLLLGISNFGLFYKFGTRLKGSNVVQIAPFLNH